MSVINAGSNEQIILSSYELLTIDSFVITVASIVSFDYY